MLSSRLLYKEDEIYEDALYCNMYKYLYYGVSTVLAQWQNTVLRTTIAYKNIYIRTYKYYASDYHL